MGAFFVYILKAAVCLSAFYLFYRLLLARETFHRFNRFAVLGILLVSLIIPFCEVRITEQSEVHQTMLSIEQLLLMTDLMNNSPVVEAQKAQTSWVHILLFTYLAGIFFFVCRNIYSLIRLALLLKSGERRKLDGNIMLIVHHRDKLAPFSWMRYVVISQRDLEENGSEILIHELAHIRKRHSIDLLIADICIFFQWFNPAAWLLKQELQNIHEYEADETVIKEGIDAKQYQLLIIKKAVGTRLYSMANGFNHSKLKKRITMMLKEKSSPWAKLKYLYVLPLAAIAVSAFARPEVSNELKEISEVKVNDLAAIVVAKPDEKQSVVADSAKTTGVYIFKSIKSTVDSAGVVRVSEHTIKSENNSKPLIFVDGQEIVANTMHSISPERIKSISVLKDQSATAQYGVRGKDGVILITLYTDEEFAERQNMPKTNLWDKVKSQLPADALLLLDGKEISNIEDTLAGRISNIKIYKIKDPQNSNNPEIAPIVEKYGEDKTKVGIIMIETKKDEIPGNESDTFIEIRKNSKAVRVQGLVVDRDNKPVVGATVIVAGKTTGTITNAEGKFILECDKNDKLIISFINMKSVSVEAAPEVTVTLEKE